MRFGAFLPTHRDDHGASPIHEGRNGAHLLGESHVGRRVADAG